MEAKRNLSYKLSKWLNGTSWTDEKARSLTERLCGSYANEIGVNYNERCGMPQREAIFNVLEQLLDLLFPGYTGNRSFTTTEQYFVVGSMVNTVFRELSSQLTHALAFNCMKANCEGDCFRSGEEIAERLMMKLPEIREILLTDAQAALDGDPAAKSLDEIILAYPGFKAISIHRIAHELYAEKIPFIPRVMSEYAHTITGIDINPGATIGPSFFIDHGTGVVVGETAVIGARVKLYQGVTLGALSFPKDACGAIIKGRKRHPNIEDDVTIYSEASILGDITIGHHSIIGGNVWLTESVPPYSKVTVSPAELSITQRKAHGVEEKR
jgi:serine O-acetyltransferase